MPNLGETFNLNELPQNESSYDPVPEGWYTVKIAEAGVQTTKAGTGRYIKLRLDILGPTHQGRVIFTNLNINNPNSQAETIGRQQLGEVMRAIGLPSVQDTDQLIGGELQVKVIIKQQDGYDPGNEVKRYKAVEGATMPVAAAKPATAAGPAKAAPPWAKK